MRDLRSLLIILPLLAGGAGCGSTTAPADVTVQLPNGLVQHVTLTPSSPRRGEEVLIRSEITNRGTAPVTLDTRICGLTLAGTLDFAPRGRCEGYSERITLAPGQSTVAIDPQFIASPPGSYRLRVQHVVEPPAWVELRVRVRSG